MNKKIKKYVAFILAFAMIITVLPTEFIIANAAGTAVYIKDTIGGETITLFETTSDPSKGWAWNAETATLTLSGFNGEYIEADNDLKIVLNGTNTITIPSSGGTGIDVAGTLTIDDTTSVTTDVLNMNVVDAGDGVTFISTYKGGVKDTVINGGTVNITGTTVNGSMYGFSQWVYVNNDAILNVDLSDEGNREYVVGCGSAAYFNSSSPCSVSVNSQTYNAYAIYSCYYNGAGALNISALGKIKTIYNIFSVASDAGGPINVKGYISGSTFYSSRKWRVKDCASYIWDYYTLDQTGYNSYLISDSNGVAIKDPVIEKVENLPLKFMDGAVFDEESIKVGESYDERPYWYYGCEGGSGSYKFQLAEDSDPLPDGITVDGAGLSGTATSTHPGGIAKIKVTSGSESATFEINYGAVKPQDHKLTIDGSTYLMNEDNNGTGWTYKTSTNTLTLNGYNGGPIASEKELNIVLNGTNTITIPSSGGKGIEVAGNLTIDDTTSTATDILNMSVVDAQADGATFISTYKGGVKNTEINGGTVNITGTTVNGSMYGFSQWVYVNNDAILNVDLSDQGNSEYVVGCGSAAYFNSSSPCSVLVNSQTNNAYAIYSCYYNGTGALNISALGKTKTINNTFSVASDAGGPINVKGYISGSAFYGSGKWRVKDCASYVWDYYTLDQTGYNSWLISDSNGVAIKDPVIEKVENLPLKFMDGAVFDEESIKVGGSYDEKPYWYYGCEGGTGSYNFELAEDSAPLPDGITVDGAGLSGTATSVHPGGTAKIKVTSGSESATFEINYGAVTYKNPVTGVTLDKDEIILNKGESAELTATVLPDTADNCDVNWSMNTGEITIEEDADKASNIRKIAIRAYSYADVGAYVVTSTTAVGSFQKTCTVYVKETKPNGIVEEDYITGLEPECAYTVNGTEITADSNGRIVIDDAWRLTTIEIVKTNTEAKCNSDVQELEIGAKAIQSNKVTLEYTSVDYDGTAKIPAVTVKYGDATLTEVTDYTLEYVNNTNAGTAKVIVTGAGLYAGVVEKEFTIRPLEMTGITVSGYNGIYDGNPHTISITGIPVGATITYSTEYDGEYVAEAPQRTDAGTTIVYYKIVKDNYKTIAGNVELTVVGTDISTADLALAQDTFEYDGTEKTPEVTVTLSGTELVKDVDYTISYEENVNAGKAKVVVNGKGSYEGSCMAEFTIEPTSIEGKTIVFEISGFTYNGTERKPNISIEGLTKDTDYKVEYADNVNAGTGKVIVTGKGNYEGTLTGTFTINAKAITPTIELDKTTFTYNGTEQKPNVTVKVEDIILEEGEYTVTYPSEMVNAGTYTVCVTLKGNYTGTASATYTITQKQNDPVVEPPAEEQPSKDQPVVDQPAKDQPVVDQPAKDQPVEDKPVAITPTIQLAKTKYVYNGKVQKPAVTVKNGNTIVSSSDYTVAYSKGCKNVGKYEVTVTLKGKYTGTATAEYVINPKATSLKKLKAGKKSLTVTWKKLTSQTTGYEIQYSTSSKFKSAKKVTVTKNKTTKKAIKKLKAKKKYYVRIRTYKTVKVNGKNTKFYSDWSKAKSIKVK